MALITPVQRAFNAGLWSKSLYGRWDLDAYGFALSKCTNMIPSVSGTLKKRPGTVFIGKAATANTGNTRLIPFVFTKTDTLVLEVYTNRIRFWTNDGAVLEEGAVGVADSDRYEIVTTYTDAEILDLDFTRRNDVIIISHRNHKPKKLSRFANNDWTFEDLDFRRGPFLPLGQVEAGKKFNTKNYSPNSILSVENDNANLIAVGVPFSRSTMRISANDLGYSNANQGDAQRDALIQHIGSNYGGFEPNMRRILKSYTGLDTVDSRFLVYWRMEVKTGSIELTNKQAGPLSDRIWPFSHRTINDLSGNPFIRIVDNRGGGVPANNRWFVVQSFVVSTSDAAGTVDVGELKITINFSEGYNNSSGGAGFTGQQTNGLSAPDKAILDPTGEFDYSISGIPIPHEYERATASAIADMGSDYYLEQWTARNIQTLYGEQAMWRIGKLGVSDRAYNDIFDGGLDDMLEHGIGTPVFGHSRPFHYGRDVGRNILINCYNRWAQDPTLNSPYPKSNNGNASASENPYPRTPGVTGNQFGLLNAEVQDVTDGEFAYPLWGKIIGVTESPPWVGSDKSADIGLDILADDAVPMETNVSGRNQWGEGIIVSWNDGYYLLGKADLVVMSTDNEGNDNTVGGDGSSTVTASVLDSCEELPRTFTLNTGQWYMDAFYEGPRSSFENMSEDNPTIYKEYPRICTFFKERLWFGSTPSLPNSLWASSTGTLDDFDIFSGGLGPPSRPPTTIGPRGVGSGGEEDIDIPRAVRSLLPNTQSVVNLTSGIAIELTGGDIAEIVWARALGDSLFCGTANGIHRVYVANQQGGFGPTEAITADLINVQGSDSKNVYASRDRIIFTGPASERVFRIGYDLQRDSYATHDLTTFNPDILSTDIVSSSMQLNPENIFWAALGSGDLASLTINEEQKVDAWAEHTLGGNPDVTAANLQPTVDAMTAIPDLTRPGDRIWLVASRSPAGAAKERYIEVIDSEFRQSNSEEDQYFLDCGVKITTGLSSTITVEHLKNEKVKIFADGYLRDEITLNGAGVGTVSGPTPAISIHVGFSYTAEAATMPLVVNDPQGSTFTKRSNASHSTAMVKRSGNFEVGAGPEEVTDWRKPDADTATLTLKEGRYQVPIPSIPARELVFGIRSTEPRNLEVTALGGFVDAASR